MNIVVQAYRKAAVEKGYCTESEAKWVIVAPEDDTGQWAPKSLAVLYLEGMNLSYWDNLFLDRCREFEQLAAEFAHGDVGYLECVNAAVCAVYR